MPRFVESYRSARDRINPEGVVVATTMGAVSFPLMIPLEASITAAIQEFTNGEPNLARLGVIAASGLANAASITIESRALREKEFSGSLGGTTWNIMTGKPRLSSTLDHLANYGLLTVANPVNAVAIYNSDSQLLIDSLIASSIVIPLWDIPVNTLIVKGKIDPVVKKMRSIRESLVNKFRKRPFEDQIVPNYAYSEEKNDEIIE